jgi:lipid II isoglutaminyl synthase (glutamine-hydrolysing)
VATTLGRWTSIAAKQLRGGGSVIGARVTLALDPKVLDQLALGRRAAIVSGTNGKSTTTAMLAAACRASGYRVATNVEGSNLRSGVVTVLSAAGDADLAVLEMDELALPTMLGSFRDPVVVLLNLSRDQLDRFGEVRTVAAGWRRAFSGRDDVTVIANADDPLVVWGAEAAARTVFVGAGMHWRLDAASCPQCGGRILVAGDGVDWHCEACSLRRPPIAALPVEVRPGVPGRHNVGNAQEALLAARELGVAPEVAATAIATVTSVEGRYRIADIDGTKSRLLLAKNPAGWAELLALIDGGTEPLLLAINARIADGKDPSWLWDVPYEQLAGRTVTAAGDRAADLAVRLHYAGVECQIWRGSLLDWLRRSDEPAVDVLANYTAFADLFRDLGPEAA